tara:strand:- start:1784 stop:2020 length:237 start_codon:yes stop_codon:yes gene_type:complete
LGKHSRAKKKHGSTISTPVQQHRIPLVFRVKFLRTSAANWVRALMTKNRNIFWFLGHVFRFEKADGDDVGNKGGLVGQ